MAEGIVDFLNPEELHKLGRLTLMSRYVVEGNLAGTHRSPQRGSSSEFADYRAYIPGDDPKNIDWKVLARTDRYFVRRYEDETNLRVYLVLDRSASMGYTSHRITKFRHACHLAAALGYVIVKERDSVGVFVHSNEIESAVPPGSSFLHLNNLLKLVAEAKPASTTRIAPTLHEIAESIHKRALVVILSDLFDEPEEVALALSHFRKQRHDVIIFHVLDPMEIDFSFRKGARFEDMESGETIDVDPRALAREYRTVFSEFMETYRRSCAEMNIDYRLVRTDQGIESFVRAYLEERRRLSK